MLLSIWCAYDAVSAGQGGRTGKAVWERKDIGGDPILVILTEQVPDSHLAGLRGEGISYIFAGKTEVDLALAFDTLSRELGIRNLLIEGGGGAEGGFQATVELGFALRKIVAVHAAAQGALGCLNVGQGAGDALVLRQIPLGP